MIAEIRFKKYVLIQRRGYIKFEADRSKDMES